MIHNCSRAVCDDMSCLAASEARSVLLFSACILAVGRPVSGFATVDATGLACRTLTWSVARRCAWSLAWPSVCRALDKRLACTCLFERSPVRQSKHLRLQSRIVAHGFEHSRKYLKIQTLTVVVVLKFVVVVVGLNDVRWMWLWSLLVVLDKGDLLLERIFEFRRSALVGGLG